MSDRHENIRSLPFEAIANALGLDLSKFKRRKAKHGPELYGPCPIHQPKNNTTSFSYSESGLWNCFSCNKSGKGAIDLIKELRGCGFQDAVAFLEVIRPLPRPEERRNGTPVASDGSAEAPRPLEKDTWRKFQVPCPWLEDRIPDQAVRERYGVFCYSNPARKSVYSGRVMLPVKDLDGALWGYLGRDISGNPDSSKYLFPKGLEKSRFLFGAYELKGQGQALPLKVLWVLESPFAVMRFAMYGLPAVSLFGWSVSDEQVEHLVRLARGVIYLPDKNKTEEAASIAGKLSRRLWCKCPPLPDGIEDPETLVPEQIHALLG